MPETLSGGQLLERFRALDGWLLEHQLIWRNRPFSQRQLPWESLYPALAGWLRSRSLADADAAQARPEALRDAPEPFARWAAESAALSRLDALPVQPVPRASARSASGVPGRKWQQIEAFAAALQFRQQAHHWLDWCAGKGHLGRRLALAGQPLTCLEHDAALVEAGQQLSQRAGIDARHLCQDVLSDPLPLRAEHTALALHACGDLHVRLLERASAAGCRQLAVAPCCYNRIDAGHYQPLSAPARGSALQLSRDELGLPLQETVTAGQRVRQQRDQSMAWRLAFDLLQRRWRGSDDYLPTPSLPASWLHKRFADYCLELAALKGLTSGPLPDWQALEAAGWQRLVEVRNLELPGGLFRRPLELWLLLDRALYLQEQGFSVRLGTFCPAELTPRNVLLLAER